MLIKALLALLVIFATNCLVAVVFIFFFAMRAPQHKLDWGEFFRLDALAFQLVLGMTAAFWLAYLFYFKKKDEW